MYFLKDAGAKCPKGKLYSKYFNKIRNLKHHGLVPQQPKEKKCVEQETRISMELDREISKSILYYL